MRMLSMHIMHYIIAKPSSKPNLQFCQQQSKKIIKNSNNLKFVKNQNTLLYDEHSAMYFLQESNEKRKNLPIIVIFAF